MLDRRQIEAELGEESGSRGGYLTPVLGEHDPPARHQSVGERHAEPSRQVVIAGARRAE